MLHEETIDRILESGWLEEINPGVMGDHYIDETYRLKEGAPEAVRKEWEEICAEFRIAG
ncbi:MAG: hypothetical protein LBG81_05675 [Coriobacteriaceae bacterium]|jgi:hypothetical protein|nr:hypothetical protein [Coriobacteriaceae bacterium]